MVRLLILLAVLCAAGLCSFTLRRYIKKAPMPLRFDRADVNIATSGAMLVEFTSPLCHECQVAYPVLQAASQAHDAPLAVINAKDRPDLAAKYSIRTTPTIMVVDATGKVTTGWFNSPNKKDLDSALELASVR